MSTTLNSPTTTRSDSRTASAAPARARQRTHSQSSDFGIHGLTHRETQRRLFHMLPGCLAFLLHVIPHADPVSVLMRWSIVTCCAVISITILSRFRKIQRLGEGTGAAPVAGYVLSVVLSALLFPGHLEIAMCVLGILAFGDGSATLFGLLLRGPRLPWNHSKSWSGLVAFMLCGTLMAGWIYWGETHNPRAANPSVTFAFALALVLPAVVVSAIAESVRSRINDNIRVGIAAAASIAAMHFMLT
jgi:phytol kinase